MYSAVLLIPQLRAPSKKNKQGSQLIIHCYSTESERISKQMFIGLYMFTFLSTIYYRKKRNPYMDPTLMVNHLCYALAVPEMKRKFTLRKHRPTFQGSMKKTIF